MLQADARLHVQQDLDDHLIARGFEVAHFVHRCLLYRALSYAGDAWMHA